MKNNKRKKKKKKKKRQKKWKLHHLAACCLQDGNNNNNNKKLKLNLPVIDGRRVTVMLRETLQRETLSRHDHLLINNHDAIAVTLLLLLLLLRLRIAWWPLQRPHFVVDCYYFSVLLVWNVQEHKAKTIDNLMGSKSKKWQKLDTRI